jgi:hypothetical protein
MSEDQEATLQVSPRTGEIVQTSLELHLRRPDGSVQVNPFHRPSLELEIESGILRFSIQLGQVNFRNLAPEEPLYKDGQLVKSGRLEVGQSLEYAGHRLRLWDADHALAYLKGYSGSYAGEIWTLGEGHHQMGRPGQRDNQIALDHPTVSRKLSTISYRFGHFLILVY